MVAELDFLDDIFLEPKENTEKNVGKFRPKVRAKTAKAATKPSETAASASTSSSAQKPQSHDSNVKQKEQVLEPHKGSSGEDAGMPVGLDSNVDPVSPSSADQGAPNKNEESLVHTEVSHDVRQVYEGDVDMQMHHDKSEAQEVLETFSLESGARALSQVAGTSESVPAVNLSSSSPTKTNMNEQPLVESEELVNNLKDSIDGSQDRENDHNSHALPGQGIDELGANMLANMESLGDFSSQPNATGAVNNGEKVQPKRQQKEGKRKSVSFVLPDATDSAAPTENYSEQSNPIETDIPSQDTMACENLEDGLDSSPMPDDWFADFVMKPTKENDISKDQFFNDFDDAGNQNVEEPNPETAEEVGATKSSRNLRKKSKEKADVDSDIRTCNLSEMDEVLSDDNDEDDDYNGKDAEKRKRVPRKSRKQKDESETSNQRRKRTSKKSNSFVEESPKKFSHALRRKRRRVDKVLLETPQNEIDRRQISIRNLILLAENNEKNWSKQAAAGQSVYRRKNPDDFDFFGGEEENHDNEENGGAQPSSTKLNYHSYMNRAKSKRWSKLETEMFYKAIQQFGTDFEMILQLFPGRTRHELKAKYKNEERKHPSEVRDALIYRSKDHSHYEELIQKLQIQPEENPQRDTTANQETESQDGISENVEDWFEEFTKKTEQEEANEWEDRENRPMSSNDEKNEAQTPAEVDDFDTAFDSDIQDVEKDFFEGF
uniref:Myb-like domain-containing protein n=1 Tax=Ananas comosus var. bracteatus TaxID=296719 RepID=A0A6V7QI70_ANACO|nr:unnamed protein product [Ananas comosus var. bracteatus]